MSYGKRRVGATKTVRQEEAQRRKEVVYFSDNPYST
jgi:hypothetical protein